MAKTAVILTNLGTPDALDKVSVKRFLAEFLSDPRVIEVPRLLWWLILKLVILPFRSGKTLQAYQRIWHPEGSPLLVYSQKQQRALQSLLGESVVVALAMRYGKPSYAEVVNALLDSAINRLIVLPLYPQNSATTTASSYHHLVATLAHRRDMPSLFFISSYHDHPAYIAALAKQVNGYWQSKGQKNHLLMSFHGLPQVNVDRGDPYYDQCLKSAHLLAKQLMLDASNWSIGFQSRFGKQVWLKPYTSDVLAGLAKENIRCIDVICPGFAADCLETLDEIQLEYRQLFLTEGGEMLNYIAALNDETAHIEMMRTLVSPYISE